LANLSGSRTAPLHPSTRQTTGNQRSFLTGQQSKSDRKTSTCNFDSRSLYVWQRKTCERSLLSRAEYSSTSVQDGMFSPSVLCKSLRRLFHADREWISKSQAARLLGVSRQAIGNAIASGRLATTDCNGRSRLYRPDVFALKVRGKLVGEEHRSRR
jgi:hypothetical protein